VETPRRNDGYDLDAILSAIDQSTRIVFLANPNNPTGTLIESSALEGFLQQVSPNVVVVIDEAYYDYARYFAAVRGVEYSSPDYVRRWQNVVLLRTFSKAHGLAGLRIGYGLGQRELIAYFARMQDTFSVSGVAQAAAVAALEDTEHVRFAVENNAIEAQRLAQEISRLGCRVVPTWANFLCCDLGQDAEAVARELRAEGVAVLPLREWGAPTSVRITVGTAEQNRIFLGAFRKFLV
jgi:histidinol-phosphate aminotransferase